VSVSVLQAPAIGVVLYASRNPWRAARVARDLQAAVEEDLGGDGLSPANFRLLARWRVPAGTLAVEVERRGLRWVVTT
jgi:hypothetical protein